MAARRWFQNRMSLYHSPVTIWAKSTHGAVGAIAAFGGRGVTSVTRLAAGRYRITLDDTYRGLLNGSAMVECAANNVDIYCQLEAENVALAGGGTVDFRTKTAGVTTDVANGDDVWYKIELMNSSVDALL